MVHDGVNVHPMLNYSYKKHAASLLYVDAEDLGAAYSITF